MSGPVATIDVAAVAANVRTLKAHTDGALMAVVKADGFGHGGSTIAKAALGAGASWLGVTSLDEAVALRQSGLRAPILSWLNAVDADFGTAIADRIDLAVPSRDHLEAIVRSGIGGRIHLHLDTGMARDGASPQEWAGLCRAARRAERQSQLSVVGVMGHLGCAEDPADPDNTSARTRFAWAIQQARAAGLRPPLRHLAATAATLTDPLSHHNLSRIGAGLVGIDPSGTTPLRPAMTLTAPVVSVRRVRAGTSVGYGHTHVTERPTTLALLGIGYADGLPRITGNRAHVLLRGRPAPIVGRISMDQIVVDVGDGLATAGDLATILGPGQQGEPTVRDWARWADTIEHEIVTGIGARVRRSTAGAAA